MAALSFGEFFVWLLLASACSMWIYWHASRHGSRHPTAWGIAAFFFWAMTVPVYFLHYLMTRRRY